MTTIKLSDTEDEYVHLSADTWVIGDFVIAADTNKIDGSVIKMFGKQISSIKKRKGKMYVRFTDEIMAFVYRAEEKRWVLN